MSGSCRDIISQPFVPVFPPPPFCADRSHSIQPRFLHHIILKMAASVTEKSNIFQHKSYFFYELDSNALYVSSMPSIDAMALFTFLHDNNTATLTEVRNLLLGEEMRISKCLPRNTFVRALNDAVLAATILQGYKRKAAIDNLQLYMSQLQRCCSTSHTHQHPQIHSQHFGGGGAFIHPMPLGTRGGSGFHVKYAPLNPHGARKNREEDDERWRDFCLPNNRVNDNEKPQRYGNPSVRFADMKNQQNTSAPKHGCIFGHMERPTAPTVQEQNVAATLDKQEKQVEQKVPSNTSSNTHASQMKAYAHHIVGTLKALSGTTWDAQKEAEYTEKVCSLINTATGVLIAITSAPPDTNGVFEPLAAFPASPSCGEHHGPCGVFATGAVNTDNSTLGGIQSQQTQTHTPASRRVKPGSKTNFREVCVKQENTPAAPSSSAGDLIQPAAVETPAKITTEIGPGVREAFVDLAASLKPSPPSADDASPSSCTH